MKIQNSLTILKNHIMCKYISSVYNCQGSYQTFPISSQYSFKAPLTRTSSGKYPRAMALLSERVMLFKVLKLPE